MSKICLLGDLHAGIHKGHTAFSTALKNFIELQLIPKLEKENIKHVIQLGDLVDRRVGISYVTMNKIRNDLVLPLLEAELELHILVGNHDIPFKDVLTPSAPAELFHGHPNVFVYNEPKEVIINDLNCVILPWICKENYDTTFNLLKNTKHRVIFGHLELNGFEMYKGLLCKDGIDPSLFQEFDLVCSGHFHQPSKSGIIQYCEAPAQYTWGDASCHRGFWILDTKTLELEFIRNPDEMFIYIEYNDGSVFDKTKIYQKFIKIIVKKNTNQKDFDLFIKNIEEYNPADLRIIENSLVNESEINEIDFLEIEHYNTLFKNYIQSLEISNKSIDKTKLELILSSIYNETLNII